MWVNMPYMDGNGKGNVSIGVWRFQQHVRGGHILGGNSLHWNLFGHSECLLGIIHQFQTKASSWWLQPETKWYSQIRSFPHFFWWGPKNIHPKKNMKNIKKNNETTQSLHQKSSTTKRIKTAQNGQPIHKPFNEVDLAWCLCDFSHCWIKTFTTHIIADTTRPHVHLKVPWQKVTTGWKSKIRFTQGVWCIS